MSQQVDVKRAILHLEMFNAFRNIQHCDFLCMASHSDIGSLLHVAWPQSALAPVVFALYASEEEGCGLVRGARLHLNEVRLHMAAFGTGCCASKEVLVMLNARTSMWNADIEDPLSR